MVGLPGRGSVRQLRLRNSGLSCLSLDSMEELREDMKLLASDLQDNNRIIEG